jgi:murein DD-endopeptidase MepM/ murein hydrolase activator NlpD
MTDKNNNTYSSGPMPKTLPDGSPLPDKFKPSIDINKVAFKRKDGAPTKNRSQSVALNDNNAQLPTSSLGIKKLTQPVPNFYNLQDDQDYQNNIFDDEDEDYQEEEDSMEELKKKKKVKNQPKRNISQKIERSVNKAENTKNIVQTTQKTLQVGQKVVSGIVRGVVMLVRLLAMLASFLTYFLPYILIAMLVLSVFAAVILFALNAVCTNNDVVNLSPQKVKDVCAYYNKLKGGCFDTPTKEETNNKEQVVKCLGKALDDTATVVDLAGIRGQTKIQKQVIKEIISEGKKAGVSIETTKLAIAMHPLMSSANGWKTSEGSCYGIALMCLTNDNKVTPIIDSINNNISQDNLSIVKDQIGFTSPNDFLKSPEQQIKALDTYIQRQKESLKNIPECLKDKFKGKTVIYKILYTWVDFQCTGDSQIEGTTKEQFSEQIELNYNTMECNEFKSKLAYIENTAVLDRPYVEEDYYSVNPFYNKRLYQSGLTVQSDAQYKLIDNAQCVELKKYKPFIEESSKRYANPTMPLSPAIIGGILSRESNVGLFIKGCDGYGDYGNGHGLGQADPSSGDGLPGRYSAKGLKVTKKYITEANRKKFGTEQFVWSDCRDGIMYIGAHMTTKQEYSDKIIRGKITSAGLSTETNADGSFKDPKVKAAYMQMLLNSYNAGQGGIQRASCYIDSTGKVYDGCTTGRNYGGNTLAVAAEAAKCMGFSADDIFSFISGGAGPAIADCVASASSSTNTGDGGFPMVTKAGLEVRWTQPFPTYLGGGAHNGIDLGIEPVKPDMTKVVAVDDGEIVNDGLFYSTSCTGGSCAQKYQRFVRLKIADNREFGYVHLDTSSNLKFFTKGAKVKKGDVLGQIDNFMFVHLHFSVYVNGVPVQPIDHIKGWPSDIKVSTAIDTKTNRFPVSLTQKLP